MARDAVANVMDQLRERGFAPRKLGHDAWESRCPAHRSSDYALSITRNEFNHVVLECRNTENCQHTRIIRALGFTNEHVYAETPDWLIRRLNGAGIQRSEFKVAEAHENHEHCPASADLVRGSGEVSPLDAGKAEASETPSEGASAIGSHGGIIQGHRRYREMGGRIGNRRGPPHQCSAVPWHTYHHIHGRRGAILSAVSSETPASGAIAGNSDTQELVRIQRNPDSTSSSGDAKHSRIRR
jgi:hypothetical protein